MHCYHGQDTPAADPIAFDKLLKVKVDSRVGRIVTAEPFSEAWKIAFRLRIDFVPTIGLRKSSSNYRALRAPRRTGAIGSRRGQLLAAPDRQIHVRGADPGFPERKRRSSKVRAMHQPQARPGQTNVQVWTLRRLFAQMDDDSGHLGRL